MPSSIRSYAYVTFNGLRYGSSMKYGGQAYRHGYVQGRRPVQIALILHVRHTRRNMAALDHTCAVVRRFVQDPDAPRMPWYLQ
jgi:hypothetical protein